MKILLVESYSNFYLLYVNKWGHKAGVKATVHAFSNQKVFFFLQSQRQDMYKSDISFSLYNPLGLSKLNNIFQQKIPIKLSIKSHSPCASSTPEFFFLISTSGFDGCDTGTCCCQGPATGAEPPQRCTVVYKKEMSI